ncbi:MAG TPA: flagellar export chaperone FliS [Acidobacteriaceae bacterium]|jgi:flagellar protein FliS|nr:flagellar export chaperone FliS [Acidobacteriaceae bacterium]
MNYQQQAIAGMNPVELIVALYDGMVRFLHQAIAATERRDTPQRRIAVGRVLDILMHLQSRLRMDVGGNSARALSEFYASIFALCLEGSRLESPARLQEAIRCVCDVRDAWRVAAHDPEVSRVLAADDGSGLLMMAAAHPPAAVEPEATRWTA